MKTRVAVMFGGKSVEHEVSVISAMQAFAALDREKYEPLPVYITKDNRFYTGEALGRIESYRDIAAMLKNAVQVLPVAGKNGTAQLIRYPSSAFHRAPVAEFDAVIPVVHGTNVEDGTLMGLLELLGVPYTGCDVASSALGMDKYYMKAVLRQAGLPVLDALCFTGLELAQDMDAACARIEAMAGYPVIVKPVNLGSSVGITKAHNRDSLIAALDTAAGFAGRVLVERAIEPLREINCSVLGDSDGVRTSVCEEPINSDEILSYADKYMNSGKTKSSGMSGLKRRCPAELPEGITEKAQQLAAETFLALGCSGVSRVDFLYCENSGELYVNEINTIPGSLSFYLWEAAGLSFSGLMDELLRLAFKRHRSREALTFSYQTNLLAGVSLGGAKGAKGAKGC